MDSTLPDQQLITKSTPVAAVRTSEIVIEPRRAWTKLRLGEIWDFRELIGLLAWRDITVRYKQTMLGALWAVAQPLAMMGMASIVFRRWVHMPSEGVPYPLFTFVALLPWLYFSNAMVGSAASLIRSSNMLTKVYFPRLIIPLASVLPPLVDFSIGFVLLMIMLMFYGVTPTWRWCLIPCLLLMTITLALGVGIWLAALSIKYRDLSHVLPFLTQMWMFASPIVYPSDLVSYRWRDLYVLNPMSTVAEGFRWAILGSNSILGLHITLAWTVTIILFFTSVIYFQYVEKTIADFI